MVVVGIFLVVMGIILANLPSFREQKILDLVAQEMVTTVRQAQIYGVSSKKLDATTYTSYGIYVRLSSPSCFVLFGDKNNPANGYTPPANPCTQNDANGEKVEIYAFPPSVRISAVSLIGGSGSAASIVYVSPHIDPTIIPSASEVQVTLISTKTGQTRKVCIASSGMVYTQPTCS